MKVEGMKKVYGRREGGEMKILRDERKENRGEGEVSVPT
jgi:hypothetical protein